MKNQTKLKGKVGVDVGGTFVKLGLVSRSKLVSSDSFENCFFGNPSALCERIAAAVNLYQESHELSLIGLSVPGEVADGVVYSAGNLGIDRFDFQKVLSSMTDCMVKCENDANAALIGEIKHGALKGYKHALMIVLGTGVGGALYLNGRLYKGTCAAGELGHAVLIRDGLPCVCGRKGCFEQYASASALLRQVKAHKNITNSLLQALCKGDLDAIDGRLFFEAVSLGDKVALELLDTFTDYIVMGLCDFLNILDTEAVVIGGGISQVGDLLMNPIAEKLSRARFGAKVFASQLGNLAGVYGGASL